jgi:glycerophosphoryl diester phosphodiesterase
VPVTRILHGAGNFRELLPSAGHPGVDAIEADVWVVGEHLVAHHDRPLAPLPLTVGWPRGIRRRPSEPVRLGEILDAVQGTADVVIDLRSWFMDPAPRLARELLALEDRAHIGVTCEVWSIADRLREWLPDVGVGYSIRGEGHIRRYLAERESGRRKRTPLAVRHTLLDSPERVEALRHHAGRVTAWTVDDVDRAIELVEWGVDAIVSNRLTVLNAV